MEDPSPLRSLTIDRALLKDCTIQRARPPNGKVYSLISTKLHPTLPLAIHNYTNKSASSRLDWDDLGLAARSLVTETTTGNVVSRSLPKFFNYHEKFAYKPTGDEHAFAIEEKVDGSLISLFWYRDQWMMVSRSAFESIHAVAARRILDKNYPGSLDRLDKELTYVFELIDPNMPIKVVYNKEDLVILSVVSKDGKEPPNDFDWTTLPFSRPRFHVAPRVTPKELSKLNLDNEEGFVVKFWSTAEDRYPKRIKVKFESYLDESQGLASTKSKKSKSSSVLSAPDGPSILSSLLPPSNARILEVYTSQRRKIQHFKPAAVSSIMQRHKENYLQSLEEIADDYGGAPWQEMIEKTWDRINAIFVLQEGELNDVVKSLQREGHKQNAKSETAKDAFAKRIKKNDVDQGFRDVLMSWFVYEPVVKQVGYFIQNMEIPADLRSTDTLRFNHS
ncbi:hypothetical protein GALMADRAFT_146983 [Galerina marginata CBS 339.88]|uniref:T4 RNA ligase 1-like N-terminal domain-containing protein n=1 Tax=Galerina marginata (strain CBS 339.88) TaxID=685588 RepID=A0A067S9X8_GALM3|nr:hypothetical protein GALMADRAFT_146983 [Galerina marginata CBS 339.88]